MTLTRKRHDMPSFVHEALHANKLLEAYKERPAYQQNDYLGWIASAKQEKTKQKRLHQMLEELQKGGTYMNMEHSPSAKK